MRHIFGIASMFIFLQGLTGVFSGQLVCVMMVVYGLLGLKVALTY